MNTQNTVINNTVELNILQNSNYQFVTLVKCSLENNFQSFISDEELPCVKDQFTREGGNKRTCPPLSLGVGGTRIKVCFLPLPPPPLPSPLPLPPLPSSPSLTRLLGTKISEGIQWYSMVQFWDTLEQTLCREPVVPLSSGSEGRWRGGEGITVVMYNLVLTCLLLRRLTTWYVATCSGDGSGSYQGFHKASKQQVMHLRHLCSTSICLDVVNSHLDSPAHSCY